jgi:hypothetical protein
MKIYLQRNSLNLGFTLFLQRFGEKGIRYFYFYVGEHYGVRLTQKIH